MAEEVQVVLHHGTVLPCEVQGFPRPSITWQREGVPIAAGNDMMMNTVLPCGTVDAATGVYLDIWYLSH